MKPFKQHDTKPTVTLSATTSSSVVQFSDDAEQIQSVRVVVDGDVIVFLRFSKGPSTATISDMPVQGNTFDTFSVRGYTHVAGITASDTAKVYITPGDGI